MHSDLYWAWKEKGVQARHEAGQIDSKFACTLYWAWKEKGVQARHEAGQMMPARWTSGLRAPRQWWCLVPIRCGLWGKQSQLLSVWKR